MSQGNRARSTKWIGVLLAWLALIGAWEGAYRTIKWKPYVFPAPSHVVDSLTEMLGVPTEFGEPLHQGWPLSKPAIDEDTGIVMAEPSGPKASMWKSPLVVALFVSSARILVGFTIALIVGGLLGVLMWRYDFMDRMFGPLFLGLQTLPSVCWVPLAILTLGINEKGIMFVLIMGSVFAIAIALRDGLRMVPPIYRSAGLMLGARKVNLYRFVLMPSSLPAIASALRQGFSFAWRSLMGGELILLLEKHPGLGYQLDVGRSFGDVGQVVATMIVMVSIGMATDRWVFASIEKKVRMRFGLLGPG